MSTRSSLSLLGFVALLGSLLSAGPAKLSAEEAWKPLGPVSASAAELKIYETLNEETSLEFQEAPLGEVVQYLQDLHGIQIIFDRLTLVDLDVALELPVTAQLSGIPLKSALRLILRDYGLAYAVTSDILLITTIPAAERYQQIEVYDVAPLLGRHDTSDALARALTEQLNDLAIVGGPDDGGRRISGYRNMLVVRETREGQQRVQRLLAAMAEGLAETP